MTPSTDASVSTWK